MDRQFWLGLLFGGLSAGAVFAAVYWERPRGAAPIVLATSPTTSLPVCPPVLPPPTAYGGGPAVGAEAATAAPERLEFVVEPNRPMVVCAPPVATSVSSAAASASVAPTAEPAPAPPVPSAVAPAPAASSSAKAIATFDPYAPVIDPYGSTRPSSSSNAGYGFDPYAPVIDPFGPAIPKSAGDAGNTFDPNAPVIDPFGPMTPSP